MAHSEPGHYVRTQLTPRARSRINSDAQLQGRENRDVVSEACEIYAAARPRLEKVCEQLDMSIPEAVELALSVYLEQDPPAVREAAS